jgi:hypothetical protein
MSSKQVQAFCNILQTFFNDIYKSYPDPSLIVLIKLIDGMVMVNPRGVVDNFMGCIEPFIEKVKTNDEKFFLDGGLTSGLSLEYTFLTDELNKIVDIWKSPETTDKTKKSIWKYFQVLVELGEKINLKNKNS